MGTVAWLCHLLRLGRVRLSVHFLKAGHSAGHHVRAPLLYENSLYRWGNWSPEQAAAGLGSHAEKWQGTSFEARPQGNLV